MNYITRIPSRSRDLKIVADFAGKEFVYLTMAWHRRGTAECAMDVNGVLATFPQKLAIVPLKVTN